MNSQRLGKHAQVLYEFAPNWVLELKGEVDNWPCCLGPMSTQCIIVEALVKEGYQPQLHHRTSESAGTRSPISPLSSYPTI